MAEAERVASSPPHNVNWVALDTMRKEYQMKESHLRTLYEERGFERPKVVRSNEEWYVRQGYQVMPTDKDEFYVWTVPHTGEQRPMPTVWLKKCLGSVEARTE